jgi:hypothetical protein
VDFRRNPRVFRAWRVENGATNFAAVSSAAASIGKGRIMHACAVGSKNWPQMRVRPVKLGIARTEPAWANRLSRGYVHTRKSGQALA